MNVPYIYKSPKGKSSHRAVIVLPEIFGLTSFVTETTDKFAKELECNSYALDFFFQLTGEPNKFDYETDMGRGIELMHKMTGEDFVNIFSQAVDHMAGDNDQLEEIIVCGFCFGGRLSYLSAVEPRVKKIVSFYGAGANTPNYYGDNSAVEILSERRADDESLSVLSLYGEDDESIPQSDREQTKTAFDQANVAYTESVFQNTGHAFFNNHRPNMYVQDSAEAAWQNVIEFIRK